MTPKRKFTDDIWEYYGKLERYSYWLAKNRTYLLGEGVSQNEFHALQLTCTNRIKRIEQLMQIQVEGDLLGSELFQKNKETIVNHVAL